MEFYEKYKKIIWITCGILLALLVYVFLYDPDTYFGKTSEKNVEVEDLVLQGYRQGHLSWLLKSKYAWSSYSLDHPVVENIYDGILYDNGEVVLRKFYARKVNVNVPQERLYATNGIKAVLVRRVDGKQKDVLIWAEELQYYSQDAKSFVRTKVTIQDEDVKVDASSAEIDHKDNTVKFGKEFVLTKPGSECTGDELLVKINEQSFQASGNVRFRRKADKNSKDDFRSKDTTVLANKFILKNISDNVLVELFGNIKVEQEDKQAIAEYARFDELSELITLRDKAEVIFLRSEEKDKLKMTAEEIIVSTKTKNLKGKGKVFIAVKDKQALADEADYDSQNEKIVLSGQAKMRRSDGVWVQANKVYVEVGSQKFIAEGQAEATIILKR